jgi:para-aminobenzoate synthetase component II
VQVKDPVLPTPRTLGAVPWTGPGGGTGSCWYTGIVSRPVLVVDNFDSFVYNLVQYLGQLGVECVVRRNDAVTVDELPDLDVAGVLLYPGPGTPADAGVTVPMVRAAAEAGTPVLGVCLGHQAIGEAFGAEVVRAPELLHGKTSQVVHEGAGVLAGLPSPFTATRYHSLAVDRDTVPAELEITGTTPSGIVMALRHRELPIEGVQFHPESVLTEGGHRMLATWLAACGLAPDPATVEAASAAAHRLTTVATTA